ncbi:GfdT protein [Pseudomonas sp. ABAC61]|nr:GfdT protein [Pseudomonas sp. ABAC61]
MQQAQSEGVVSAMSQAGDPQQVAQDLARQLLHPHLGFVLFFCSAEYPLQALGQALQQGFGGIRLVGCTSAGEITPQGYGRNCVTAIGFDHRHFSIAAELIDQMEHFSLIDAQQMVERLVGGCRSNTLAPIKGNTFALTLLDGLSSREEMVLAALSAALGDIPHFGGSAGDDNYLTHTHVYFGGEFHSGAAVVVLVNTWLDFEVFTTHHILPREEKLVVTGVDSTLRRVYELNNQHYYVRAVQQVHPDLSLSFYCAVENGIVLTAMTPGPLLPNLQTLFDGLQQRLGSLLLTIGCDCFLRRLELEDHGSLDQIGAFLREQRVMGFNTYGEQFNGMHINQTFTGVAIARSRTAARR